MSGCISGWRVSTGDEMSMIHYWYYLILLRKFRWKSMPLSWYRLYLWYSLTDQPLQVYSVILYGNYSVTLGWWCVINGFTIFYTHRQP
jgi:hypothetical protein